MESDIRSIVIVLVCVLAGLLTTALAFAHRGLNLAFLLLGLLILIISLIIYATIYKRKEAEKAVKGKNLLYSYKFNFRDTIKHNPGVWILIFMTWFIILTNVVTFRTIYPKELWGFVAFLVLITAAIFVTVGIVLGKMDVKIYENGILLNDKTFVSWDEIKDMEEKDNCLILKLKNRGLVVLKSNDKLRLIITSKVS